MILEIIAICVSVLTPVGSFLGSLILYRKQVAELQKNREHDSIEKQKDRDHDFRMKMMNRNSKEINNIFENLKNNLDVSIINKKVDEDKDK